MNGRSLLAFLGLFLAACASTITHPVSLTPTTIPETATTLTVPVLSTATISPTATPEITFTPPIPPQAKGAHILESGQPLTLIDIWMIDELNGWAIDRGNTVNNILHTQDGGHSWSIVSPLYAFGYNMFAARGFFALDANIAWLITPQMLACYVVNFNCTVVSDTALLWKTTDGGNHWQGQFVSSVPWGYVPMSIQFVDKQTGWLLLMSFIDGNLRYQLHQTTDGGEHWQQIMIVDTHPTVRRLPDKEIAAVVFQDSRNGWMGLSEICCEAQVIKEWKIYHSTDAGSTWEPFLLPAPDPLPATFLQNPAQCAAQDIEVTQPNILDVIVYCYVYEGDAKPEFWFHYHSPDGGNQWVSFQRFGDVQFIDALLGWRMLSSAGSSDIERTEDGGVTWTKLKTVQWRGNLHFINRFVGWVIATSSNEETALLHTVDGGRTWDKINPVATGQ